MNPIKQIGRWELPILSVSAIRKRDLSGIRRFAFWIKPGYDVLLSNGYRIHFTEEEKEAYDKALEEHNLTMQVLGMARGMGLRG